MKRFRIRLEIGLLLAVVAFASLVWNARKAKPERDAEPITTEMASDSPSRLKGFIKQHQSTSPPRRVTTRLPVESENGFALDSQAEGEAFGDEPAPEAMTVLLIHLVDPLGRPVTLPGQIFSSDCGFTVELENGEGEFLLAPGRCRIQAQAQEGALLHRSAAVGVDLIAGETVTVEILLPTANLSGPGFSLSPEENYAVVAAVDPFSPAAELNLRPGHIIIEIDGQPVEGMTEEELNLALQGPAASSVRLTMVIENDAGDFEEVTVDTLRQHLASTEGK